MTLPLNRLVAKVLSHKRNLLIVSFSQLLTAIGTLIGVRLMTEVVSPAVFGQYKLILAAIALLTAILIRPFMQFVMREYHDAHKAGTSQQFTNQVGALFRTHILLVSAFAAAISGLFLTRLFPLTPLLTLLMIAVLALGARVELQRALLVTRNMQLQAGMVSAARSWLIPIAIVSAILLTQQHVAVMLAATLSALIGILTLLAFRSPENARLSRSGSGSADNKEFIRNALRFGAPLAVVGMLSWIVHESDRLFLSYYLDDHAVGIYAAAYGLVSAPFTLVVGSMAQFLYPIMFRASASGNHQNRNNILLAMLATSAVICLLCVVFVALFAQHITWLTLGESYRQEAAGLLVWIAAGYGLMAVSTSFDLAAYGAKRTTDILLAFGASSIVNLVLNIALIPEYGPKGAAIATFFALLTYFIAMSTVYMVRGSRAVASAPSTTTAQAPEQ